ncbi:MAG: di-trans,poly-cis-decaprenylcistransferase [Acidobacteria bacterium]|nr:di-trans,poly-cis-decaprenylcistransferase [Acidobacteriota bacterium]
MRLHAEAKPGLHVAIIMDGNGRWARERGLAREAGHRAGADAVRRVVEAAPKLGVRVLTLYAFSADNWKRPPREVSALMRLFRLYLGRESGRCAENGVRISVIGRRDRLSPMLVPLIEQAERETAGGTNLHLRLAVDYSSREAILRAAAGLPRSRAVSREEFARLLDQAQHSAEPAGDVDLLIRSGGEQRLSDFLLWECAYAELSFTPRMWPDFAAADLESALNDYYRRDRRFGAVPAIKAG